MKKLSKFLALLVALVTVFTFGLVGCSEEEVAKYKEIAELDGKSTQVVYTQIMETVEELNDNFTATVDYQIPCKVSASGYSTTLNMRSKSIFKMSEGNWYEYTYLNTGDIDTGAETIPGEVIVAETYLVDGTVYLNSDGVKYKYGATIEQLAQFLEKDVEELWNPIYDFSDTAFEDVKFSVNKKDSSDIYFEIKLKGEDASAFALENLESLEEYLDFDISFGDISYKFIITELGELKNIEVSYKVNIKMNMDGMSMKMEYKFNGDISFSDIGTTTISAPADADDYLYIGDLADILPSAE